MKINGITLAACTGTGTQDRITTNTKLLTRFLCVQTDPANANDVKIYGANGVQIGVCPGGGGTFTFPTSFKTQDLGDLLRPSDYYYEGTAATPLYCMYEDNTIPQ